METQLYLPVKPEAAVGGEDDDDEECRGNGGDGGGGDDDDDDDGTWFDPLSIVESVTMEEEEEEDDDEEDEEAEPTSPAAAAVATAPGATKVKAKNGSTTLTLSKDSGRHPRKRKAPLPHPQLRFDLALPPPPSSQILHQKLQWGEDSGVEDHAAFGSSSASVIQVTPLAPLAKSGRSSSGARHHNHLHHNQMQQQLLAKEFAVLDERRLQMQLVNAKPRSTCPICGDKANGLHYGIYSCEGCKNFFKRSVQTCVERPYVCKYDNSCSVTRADEGGVRLNSSRCQACRYQACLDAGMYHSGIQRSRGGRQNQATGSVSSKGGSGPGMVVAAAAANRSLNGGAKAGYEPDNGGNLALSSTPHQLRQQSPLLTRYPQVHTPDIAAHVMAAGVSQSDSGDSQGAHDLLDPETASKIGLVRRGSRSSSSSGGGGGGGGPKHNGIQLVQSGPKAKRKKPAVANGDADDFYAFAERLLQQQQPSGNGSLGDNDDHGPASKLEGLLRAVSPWRQFHAKAKEEAKVGIVRAELDLMASKNKELSAAMAEKDRQLAVQQSQIGMLKRTLAMVEKVNGEQNSVIDKLKAALLRFCNGEAVAASRASASSGGVHSLTPTTTLTPSRNPLLRKSTPAAAAAAAAAVALMQASAAAAAVSKAKSGRHLSNETAFNYERQGVTITRVTDPKQPAAALGEPAAETGNDAEDDDEEDEEDYEYEASGSCFEAEVTLDEGGESAGDEADFAAAAATSAARADEVEEDRDELRRVKQEQVELDQNNGSEEDDEEEEDQEVADQDERDDGSA